MTETRVFIDRKNCYSQGEDLLLLDFARLLVQHDVDDRNVFHSL